MATLSQRQWSWNKFWLALHFLKGALQRLTNVPKPVELFHVLSHYSYKPVSILWDGSTQSAWENCNCISIPKGSLENISEQSWQVVVKGLQKFCCRVRLENTVPNVKHLVVYLKCKKDAASGESFKWALKERSSNRPRVTLEDLQISIALLNSSTWPLLFPRFTDFDITGDGQEEGWKAWFI